MVPRSGAAACTCIASAAWLTLCRRCPPSRNLNKAADAVRLGGYRLRQAKLFADRVKEGAGDDAAKQIDMAYRIALTRPPRAEEAAIGIDFLKQHTLTDFTHVLLNLNEFLYVR